MKEVKAKRYADSFKDLPFQHFIQSPIGLVPKDGGKETRLIFCLSYPKDGKSINSETPKHLTSVTYPYFNKAIRLCMQIIDEEQSKKVYQEGEDGTGIVNCVHQQIRYEKYFL